MAGLLSPQRQPATSGLLDQAPRRVDDRVAGLLGLDPSIQRGSILPFGRDASGEMVMAWPEMALDTIKAAMLPGHVMQGGEFTPRDVTEMALDVGMLSSVTPAPAGAKRMFGGIDSGNVPPMNAGVPKAEAAAYLASRTGVTPADASRWLDRFQPDPRNSDGSFNLEQIRSALGRAKDGEAAAPGVTKADFGAANEGPSLESLAGRPKNSAPQAPTVNDNARVAGSPIRDGDQVVVVQRSTGTVVTNGKYIGADPKTGAPRVESGPNRAKSFSDKQFETIHVRDYSGR